MERAQSRERTRPGTQRKTCEAQYRLAAARRVASCPGSRARTDTECKIGLRRALEWRATKMTGPRGRPSSLVART